MASPIRVPLVVPTLAAAVVVGCATVCVLAARSIDLRAATDVGVLGLLTWDYWAALAMLTVTFALLLGRWSAPQWLLALCVVALVVALFGIPVFASDVPRLNVSYRHAGLVENLARTGSPDVRIDAYFSWPGFFMLGALLTSAAGLPSAVTLTTLAPLYTNLAFLPPLVLVVRALTADRQRRWLTVWLYYLTQWANQDYFAPQSYTYVLYLVTLAVLLRWFCPAPAGPRWHRGRPGPRERLRTVADARDPLVPLPAGTRTGLFVVVVVLVLATVPSHQLTPFAILVALLALGLAHGRSFWTLAAVVAVATTAWLLFMADAYLAGHLSSLLEDVGDVQAATSANIGERLHGSPGHQLVVRVRLLLTAGIALMALAGLLRRLWRGYWDGTAALLAGAAYALVPVQAYGGEMLLRCYFFSLPFLAFLAAAALLPAPGNGHRRRWAVPVAVVAVTAVLAPALVISRYGNARIDQFTPQETLVISRMYAAAGPGSALVAVANNVPWKSEEYEAHRYRFLPRLGTDPADAPALAARVAEVGAGQPGGAVLVVTRSQLAFSQLYGGVDERTVSAVEDLLVRRYGWRLSYENQDGRFYLSPTPRRDP